MSYKADTQGSTIPLIKHVTSCPRNALQQEELGMLLASQATWMMPRQKSCSDVLKFVQFIFKTIGRS